MNKRWLYFVEYRAMSLTARCLSGCVFFIASTLVMAAPDASGTPQADVKKLYQKYCSVCHGDQGNGDTRAAGGLNPKPRNFTTEESAKELSRQRMIDSVAHGRPGTAMVGHAKKLSPQQIEAVVDYVRATFMKLPGSAAATQSTSTPAQRSTTPMREPHERGRMDGIDVMPAPPVEHAKAEATPADMKLPMPKNLKGNVQAGQAFYMKNCFTCHGVKGDGNGPRSYFIAPRPRNFTSEQSRQTYNRPVLFGAISNGKRGTVMPAWGKVLSEQQIADVAEFVFQGFIRDKFKVVVPPELADEQKKKVP